MIDMRKIVQAATVLQRAVGGVVAADVVSAVGVLMPVIRVREARL